MKDGSRIYCGDLLRWVLAQSPADEVYLNLEIWSAYDFLEWYHERAFDTFGGGCDLEGCEICGGPTDAPADRFTDIQRQRIKRAWAAGERSLTIRGTLEAMLPYLDGEKA